MKKISKKEVSWRCSVCGTDYEKKSDARRCERAPIEKQKFKIGDRVTSLAPRECLSVKNRGEYKFSGVIKRVLELQPPPKEDLWRFMGKQPKTHVFLYEVTYRCSRCGKKKGAAYFAPELKKVK